MSKANAEHIVQYFGSTTAKVGDTFYLLLVMEFCEHGSLFDVITQDKNELPGNIDQQSFRVKRAAILYASDFACQAAKGLRFVHEQDVVHRDIKPDNFLVHDFFTKYAPS